MEGCMHSFSDETMKCIDRNIKIIYNGDINPDMIQRNI